MKKNEMIELQAVLKQTNYEVKKKQPMLGLMQEKDRQDSFEFKSPIDFDQKFEEVKKLYKHKRVNPPPVNITLRKERKSLLPQSLIRLSDSNQ